MGLQSFRIKMTRLRYLYEQREIGKERIIYYCAGCGCVLNVRRDSKPAMERARCPGCGGELEGNLRCRPAPTPEEWPYASQDSRRSPGETVLFRRASSMPHFSLGFPRLDSMLRPLVPGSFIVLSGEPASAVAELAAFRAQLPLVSGGLDSTVFFVDCGNRSDPYLFSSFAKQNKVGPVAAMRKVVTCRAFTMYQLADLATHIAEAADRHSAMLVVVSDLLAVFNEPELERREARRVLSAIEQGIAELKKKALVIATLVSQGDYDDTVASWGDTVVSMSLSGRRVRAELLRSKRRPPAVSTFLIDQLMRPGKREVA
jgi:Rad51